MTLSQTLQTCVPVFEFDDPVCETVATALKACSHVSDDERTGTLKIGVRREGHEKEKGEWACVSCTDGDGEMLASSPAVLFSLYARIRDQWGHEPVEQFREGRWLRPTFTWLTGRYGFLRRRKQPIGPDDIHASMQELARLGCTHVVINELAPRSFETGPAGEVYYRFYDYTPEIDQYVETD